MAKFIKLTRYDSDDQIVINTSSIKAFKQYMYEYTKYTQIITDDCTYQGIVQTPEEILELMKNAVEI